MKHRSMISERANIKSRARTYFSKRDWKKALVEYEKIVRLDPDDLRARLKVGDLLQKLGRTDEAVSQYKELARHYIEEGFLIQAISLAKIVRRIDPSQVDIQRELTGLCAQVDTPLGVWADGQLVRKRLREIPLLSELKQDELEHVIERIRIRRVTEGDFVCKEGESGDSIFFIASGEVRVSKHAKKKEREILLAKLREGDFFGEFGFFSDQKRHASVRAETDLEVLEISKDDFDEIANTHPRIRKILLNFYKKRVIDTLLAFSPLFGQLPPDKRAQLVSRFKLQSFGPNSLIFDQGSPPKSFYVIKSGEVEVFVSKNAEPKVTLGYLRHGDFFGEISLILDKPRMASVRTTQKTHLLELEKRDFDYIVGTYTPIKVALESIARKRLKSTRQIISSHWTEKAKVKMV